MKSLDFFTAEDYRTGIFVNSRIDDTITLSVYDDIRIVPDTVPLYSTSLYGISKLPLSGWNNTAGDLTSVTAKTGVVFNVEAYAVDIIGDNTPTGAFVSVVLDGQNLENFSLYGEEGTQTVQRIQLNGYVSQNLTLYHSGSIDQNSPSLQGPVPLIGSSMPPAILLQPNQTTRINDTFVLIDIDQSSFTMERLSTGMYNIYSTDLAIADAIPGFNLQVSGGSLQTGDSAQITTLASEVRIYGLTEYNYPSVLPQYVTPIMGSDGPSTQWTGVSYEIPLGSISPYMQSFSVGNTTPPDNTWVTVNPSNVGFVDHSSTTLKPAYRSVTITAEQATGQYAQAVFNIGMYTDFLRKLSVYQWNPYNDPVIKYMGPVITGPNMQGIMGSFAMLLYNTQKAVYRLLGSTARSSSEREYILQWGQILNVPMHLFENFDVYKQRLIQYARGRTLGGRLAFNQQLIQTYCNSTKPYIKTLYGNIVAWRLGLGYLGIDTYLGSTANRIWQYEVHVPGALPGLVPSAFETFVYQINPVGAIPIFIYE